MTPKGRAGSIPAPSTQKSLSMVNRKAFLVKEDKVPPKLTLAKLLKDKMVKAPYRAPKIIRAKRGWFIALYYEYPDRPGEYKRFEISGGVNYIHKLEEREKEIKKLLKALKHELENGLNPFFPELEDNFVQAIENKESNIQEVKDILNPSWTLDEAFDKYIEDCRRKNLSANTIRTYESFISNFKIWTSSNPLNIKLRAKDVDQNTVLKCLDELYDEEEWSPRTYNNHLRFFVTFFNRIRKLEKKDNGEISYVIDLSDIEYKKDRAEKNRYYTPDVAKKVKEHLRKNAELTKYVEWIYYSCMRPREIRFLQIQHIDLKNRQIKAVGPTAKTGDRFVPICDELYHMISQMNLKSFPPNYFVFGKGGEPNEEGGPGRSFMIKDMMRYGRRYR